MTERKNRRLAFSDHARAIVTAAALLAAACGDGGTEPEPPQPNRAPVTQGSIPAQTVAVGESVTVSVASAFSDPDGDALTYAAASSAPGVASVAVSGANVTVMGVSPGTANVTVTATDPDGLSAQQAFQATVPNRAPVVTDSIPGQTLQAGDTASVNLADHFSDPDGDALTYAAESSATGVASVTVSESTVTIAGGSVGTAIVTVTATDPEGLSASLAVEVTVSLSERAVLKLFYEATGGENWIQADNWLTDAPLGDWYGVTVNDDGAIVSLQLPVSFFGSDGNALTGSIPPELGQLSALEVLDLSGNDLTGSIPAELGQLSALRRLDLSWIGAYPKVGLTGAIPPELGQLSALEELELFFNDLTGAIPPELGQLSALEVLDLLSNELTGPIPQELAQLPALRRLDLSSNDLTGSVPAWLGQLSALESLDLSANRDLAGPIPMELLRLTKLKDLDLAFINLAGAIPAWLGQLSALVDLSLSGNDLTGPIPTELAQLSKLEDLWLGFNDLSGPIPAELSQLSALEVLVAYYNVLAGPLPAELDQLSELGALLIHDNELTDPFPASFTSLGEVWWLEWQDNAGLCAPQTAAFDAWLAGIESQFLGSWSGPRCGAADAHHVQLTAVYSAEIRHLEDRLAAETLKADLARDREEAMEIQEATKRLRSEIEDLRHERGGGRGNPR